MCAATRPQGQVSGWSTLGVCLTANTPSECCARVTVEDLRGPLARSGWHRGGLVSGPVTALEKLVLEKGGGTARPELAFFFGDFLQVGDVCASLREYVMEIVANADEGKTFVEKFADARCTEEEESQDHVIFVGGFDQTLRGGI